MTSTAGEELPVSEALTAQGTSLSIPTNYRLLPALWRRAEKWMTESTKRSHPPRNPPLLISRAQPVISAGRRSSRQCCCGLLCAPARINHPQERAELLCECWSQRETAVSASLPQSPLLPPLSPTQAPPQRARRVRNAVGMVQKRARVGRYPSGCSGACLFPPGPPGAEQINGLYLVSYCSCQQAEPWIAADSGLTLCRWAAAKSLLVKVSC